MLAAHRSPTYTHTHNVRGCPPTTHTRLRSGRDACVHRLNEAFAEGRLADDELATRVEQALAAKTHGELVALVGDLPPAPVPRESDVIELTSARRIERTGRWRVPRRLRVSSEYGGAKLDLSKAVIEHPVVEIELRVPYGSIVIILPPGATADVNGIETEWGRVRSKVDSIPERGTLHVQITGEVGYGRMKIRHARI